MGNLMRMNLYRMFRMKKLWIFSGIIALVTFIAPLLGILFSNLYTAVAEATQDAQSIAEAEMIAAQINSPVEVSYLFMSPYSGFSVLLIFVMVSVASYLYADFSRGYIKNLIGQLPSKGQMVMANFLTIGIHDFIMLTAGLIGLFIGNMVTHQLNFDSRIPMGLLIYLVKFLLMWAMTMVVFFFVMGLRNMTLGVITGVVIGSGSLQIIYLALNFGLSKLFQSDIDVTRFVPDQLFSETFALAQDWNQFVLYALISSVAVMGMFLLLTFYFFRKQELK